MSKEIKITKKLGPTIDALLNPIVKKTVEELVYNEIEIDPDFGIKAVHIMDLKNAFKNIVSADALNLGSENMEYHLLDKAVDYLTNKLCAGETTLDEEPGYFVGF